MLANQPKNDTLYIKGFNIVVENRAFTYRQVAQNVGQKSCLMPAHYGYLQNNPKVGVFVGAFPENDTVYLINQKAQGGYFDKHIAMFGFLSEQQAVDTYQKCFEYGYIGLMSVIPCTIEQLKWWLINGDKSRPVTKERLPYAGLERLDSVLWGGEDKADLTSHSGQVAKLLYQIRQSDSFNHALEPLSYHDLTQELGNQGFVYENYDALVVEYNKLERKAKQMLMAMQGAADIVKPVGVAVSKPLNKGGVSNVVAWFEMDDGQAVGVFFHNPDKTPKKIDPTDEMISYKWVLNKKDITIVVAPENGKDLVIRTVAKRIMKLVDANHNLFLKANSDKAELNLKEQNLGQLVIEKQAELDALNKAIELLEAQKAEKKAQTSGEQLLNTGYDGIKSKLKGMAWVDDPIVQGGLVKSFIGAQESGDTNPDGILSISINRNGVNIAAKVGADTIIPNSVEFIPQYGIDAQSTQNYKKVADKINNAVEDYVAKRREAESDFKASAIQQPSSIDYSKYPVITTDDRYGEIIEVPTIWGDKVRVAKRQLENVNRTLLKRFTKAGKEVDGDSIHRENLLVGDAKLTEIAQIEKELKEKGYKVAPFPKSKQQEKKLIDEGYVGYSLDGNGWIKPSFALAVIYAIPPISQPEPVTLTGKELENPTPPQDRPLNWRTNLANARAVAKSLGIETKGKNLSRLLREIDIFDEKEVKKELLSEFKALASRLVLPKGYVFDLSDAEKSIDDITRSTAAWIRKQGKIDTNTIRVELRTIPDSSQGVIFNSVHIYTDDPKTKKVFDKFSYQRFGDIGASSPETPKEIIAKMELYLTKFIFPEIEYQKVVNSKAIEPSQLSKLGMANIESIGDENVYIEKDGKYYISKVGNTEDYALGEWDFAKYPEGKPVEPVTQPEQAPVASSLGMLKKLSKNTEFDSWAIKHGVDEGVAKSILDTNINGHFLFELVTHDLPPNDELLKFQDGSILTYYRAKSEDVKSLSDEAFNLLLSQDDYNEKTGYFAYNILRNSNKKAELDYVSSLGAMNNRFRLDAQKYGGKLYKMAQPYLNNQPVEAQPEPVSEQPMTNPDRDYLQSIIDGEADLEAKGITAKIREIVLKAKDVSDTEMLALADKAAKTYATYAKTKAAAKLAEVQ